MIPVPAEAGKSTSSAAAKRKPVNSGGGSESPPAASGSPGRHFQFRQSRREASEKKRLKERSQERWSSSSRRVTASDTRELHIFSQESLSMAENSPR